MHHGLVEHRGHTVHLAVSDAASTLIADLGGHLHATFGPAGCRARSLVFSTDEPSGAIEVGLAIGADADEIDWDAHAWTPQRLEALAERVLPSACRLTVGEEIVGLLDGAELDVATSSGRERFVWTRLPTGDARSWRRCTCLRSLGEPRGRRSPCLDDARQGLVELR